MITFYSLNKFKINLAHSKVLAISCLNLLSVGYYLLIEQQNGFFIHTGYQTISTFLIHLTLATLEKMKWQCFNKSSHLIMIVITLQ